LKKRVNDIGIRGLMKGKPTTPPGLPFVCLVYNLFNQGGVFLF
jgi:hypothetical protein